MNKFFVFAILAFSSISTFASEVQKKDQYLNYDFGPTFVNSQKYADFILTARGPEATEVESISVDGPMFEASTNCPKVLPVGQECVTRVYYWPRMQGPHSGDLTLILNDGNIHVSLYGTTYLH